MGQASSSTANITLDRIRATCQKDSNVPQELQQFNIELLANDMNKLGYDIAIRDSRGKAHSSDEICRRLHESLPPSVESVCMRGPRAGSETLRNLVNHFNKYYGANIFLKKDPRNPRSGDRNVSDVCDDLYLTADRVHNSLQTDTRRIKKQLEDSISSLRVQKNELDNVFAQQLSNLHRGADYDRVSADIGELNALQHGMVGTLDNNLNQLKDIYNKVDHKIELQLGEVDKEYKKAASGYLRTRSMNPLGMLGNPLGTLGMGNWFVGGNGTMRGGGGPLDVDPKDLEKIMAIHDILPMLAVTSSQCSDCIKEFYGDHESERYSGLSGSELHSDLTYRLDSKLRELHDKGTIDSSAYKKLVKCYQKLLHNQQQCSDSMKHAKESFPGLAHSSAADLSRVQTGGGYENMSAGSALSELLQ